MGLALSAEPRASTTNSCLLHIFRRVVCDMEKLPDASPQLSILVPVYNENASIAQTIQRLLTTLNDYTVEILIVDDGSYDGTTEQIRTMEYWENVRLFFHNTNQGKGAALRTAFAQARGQIVVVQDADLEYDPLDIPRLVQPILDGCADVVYGSRFRGESQRVHLFWHRVANALLTLFSNMLTNLNLSDMETGYKAFSHETVKKLVIRENRFGVEPELTAKVAKLGCRVYEVPISYHGRDYAEGKKIGFRDALWAVWCIIRYGVAD
ncbi:MAG: glycosyltransferase family 2 protein [Pirellulales bacterium]|nr:glycosyltransferase family 2 protein [Pirellulales bacterium]